VALLSYMIEPFLSPDQPVSSSHTRYWEARQMARTFCELGYDDATIAALLDRGAAS
jgi:hypothetical protein